MKRKRGRQPKNLETTVKEEESEDINDLSNNNNNNLEDESSDETKSLNQTGQTLLTKTTNKIEDVKIEIKEESSITVTPSGRSQRIRKKPKRWDDDAVEVDFTGQSNLLGLDDGRGKKKDEIKVDTAEPARRGRKPQNKQTAVR